MNPGIFKVFISAALLCSGSSYASQATNPLNPQFDGYGGWTGVKLNATGDFRVEKYKGRWWFVTPEGHPYFKNSASDYITRTQEPDFAEGSPEAFRKSYMGAGFNAIGAWNGGKSWSVEQPTGLDNYPVVFDKKMPYTVILPGGVQSAKNHAPLDYFDPSWRQAATNKILPVLNQHKNNPALIGFYYGNEFHWSPNHKRPIHVFDDYLRFDKNSAGKKFTVSYIRTYYANDIQLFNRVWGGKFKSFDELHSVSTIGPKLFFDPGASLAGEGNTINLSGLLNGSVKGLLSIIFSDQPLPSYDQTKFRYAFSAAVAEKFFSEMKEIINQNAPGKLILGERQLVLLPNRDVASVVGRYSDVVSLQPYAISYVGSIISQVLLTLTSGGYGEFLVSREMGSGYVSDFLKLLPEKPVVISEYGIQGGDVAEYKNKNTFPGVFPIAATQETRAKYLEAIHGMYLQTDQIIGMEFFQWRDQPVEGRQLDGENNQNGIVSRTGQPHYPVYNAFVNLNKKWVGRVANSEQRGTRDFDAVFVGDNYTRLSTSSTLDVSAHSIRSSIHFGAWAANGFFFKQSPYQFMETIKVIKSFVGLSPEAKAVFCPAC
jgi:hypothetical protein